MHGCRLFLLSYEYKCTSYFPLFRKSDKVAANARMLQMFVVFELMKTTGSWPSTPSYTSHEPRKLSPAQWVKSVKWFLAWMLKVLPSCIITKTIRLYFVSAHANLTNVLKWWKLSATHHQTRTGHWWMFWSILLILPWRYSWKTKLSNILHRWIHCSFPFL